MQLSLMHSCDWQLTWEDLESSDKAFGVQRLRGSKINKPVGESDQSVRSVQGSLIGHPAGSLVSALCLSWGRGNRRGWGSGRRIWVCTGKTSLACSSEPLEMNQAPSPLWVIRKRYGGRLLFFIGIKEQVLLEIQITDIWGLAHLSCWNFKGILSPEWVNSLTVMKLW